MTVKSIKESGILQVPYQVSDTWTTVTGTTGSPTTGSYTDSSTGITYDWWRWTGSGSVTFGMNGFVDFCIVAGGGGGSYNQGGGGGGGGVIIKKGYVTSGTKVVGVGAGGAAFLSNVSQGSTSYIEPFYAIGGGGGPTSEGGCGSGGGGAGVEGQGWAGASGNGGGGGAWSPGVGTTGGTGATNSYDGTSRVYSKGGNSNVGSPVAGPSNTGNGGDGNNVAYGSGSAGGSGVVMIRIGR